MQIIEVSFTGVRSSVITLQNALAPMRFVLFPMVHLGSPEFYQAVAGRLGQCQLIVTEGVSGRSLIASALTLAYRLPARNRKLGLVVQHIDYDALGVPLSRPDVTGQQFRRRWRSIPLLQRLAVWCLVPPLAIGMTLFGTRRFIARFLALDGLATPEDDQMREAAGELARVLVDDRDALLIDDLVAIYDSRHNEQIDVAVVYGAGHMPAVAHELWRRCGYRPRTAEWVTVFDF